MSTSSDYDKDRNCLICGDDLARRLDALAQDTASFNETPRPTPADLAAFMQRCRCPRRSRARRERDE